MSSSKKRKSAGDDSANTATNKRAKKPSKQNKSTTTTVKQNATTRSGLSFPIPSITKALKAGKYSERIGTGASIYIAAVLQYLTTELLDLAGAVVQDEQARESSDHTCNINTSNNTATTSADPSTLSNRIVKHIKTITPSHLQKAIADDEELRSVIQSICEKHTVQIKEQYEQKDIAPDLLQLKKQRKKAQQQEQPDTTVTSTSSVSSLSSPSHITAASTVSSPVTAVHSASTSYSTAYTDASPSPTPSAELFTQPVSIPVSTLSIDPSDTAAVQLAQALGIHDTLLQPF